jgi:hypothetical protein
MGNASTARHHDLSLAVTTLLSDSCYKYGLGCSVNISLPMAETVRKPHAHAEALLAVAAGAVAYRRIDLSLDSGRPSISRCGTPEPLDLITPAFESEEPAWIFSLWRVSDRR